MQILVTGREGQLGSTLFNYCKRIEGLNFSFTTIEELDLSNEERIRAYFAGRKFDLIVNCAAYTAVDKAETDPDTARAINARALTLLGEAAAGMNAGVIHISTDYVFSGKHYKPLTPEDETGPRSVYGQTKLEGEQNLLNTNAKSIIIRTSWLYSPIGENFMKTMLKLGKERTEVNVVADQIGSPTLADDLAKAILHIINGIHHENFDFVPGIYHYANQGVCSWYDFATAIFEIAGLNCLAIPVGSKQFPRPAPRPWYSVLDKSKIKETFALYIPHWRKSLETCLTREML